jgi:hypothetical protein
VAAADPAVRRLVASENSNKRWSRASKADRRTATEAMRAEKRRRLEQQVDPDGTLDPADRDARVRNLIRAEMARLARLSVQARQVRRHEAELDQLLIAESAQ